MNEKVYITITTNDGKEIGQLTTYANLPEGFSFSSNRGIGILKKELNDRLANLISKKESTK